ncbi:uncharacterized protein [Temnothorax nylanderi]|uniref:uncharacterized protein n=1 Tax=Temnothorax nylanderi TaxID=102681 RepID=UPI003A88B0B2
MTRDKPAKGTRCNLALDAQLHESMARFWQLEHNIRQNTQTPEERYCERHYASTYKRNEQGRFIVTLPTRDEQIQKLGDSFEIAVQQFKRLERRLERNPSMKKEYNEFMKEYLQLGHMRKLPHDSASKNVRPHCYLPHHCVIKKGSVTTHLRVVFNASSETTTGISLNDALMAGPVVQPDVIYILLTLRIFIVVLIADIAKMYRQILINEAQVPLQRIVWREHPTEELRIFELLTLTYGTVPASYLAIQTILQLAKLLADRYPKGALMVLKRFYMDNFAGGARNKEEARIVRDEVANLLHEGGFILRMWASNDQNVLSDMAASLISNHMLELDKDGTTKTLGVKWNPTEDVFQYEINVDSSRGYTKRTMLSAIASIFDPLGLLAPVVLTAKIMIQNLWKLKVGWDESLPSDIYTETRT